MSPFNFIDRKTWLKAALAVVAIALVAVGCSRGPQYGEKRAAWRNIAERNCLRSGQVTPNAYIETAPKIRVGACGANNPFKVMAADGGRVGLSPPATLACPVIPAFDRWLADSVQPMAYALFGSPVAEVNIAASYGCRTRNHKRGAPLSEHSFANAIDIASFELADGRTISVLDDWHSDGSDAIFLRTVHGDACKEFTTVIGPDGDRHHADHFHFDLARHNKDGSYHHCE
ncbi:extensin family protein [Amorphus coralli]|uniref:extensin-like domain-containing protein n=1 Tax=Amorphus coralli TaxID=340680 RepID=UPI00042872D9|nr:extensin family protein [Amorphus coralli]